MDIKSILNNPQTKPKKKLTQFPFSMNMEKWKKIYLNLFEQSPTKIFQYFLPILPWHETPMQVFQVTAWSRPSRTRSTFCIKSASWVPFWVPYEGCQIAIFLGISVALYTLEKVLVKVGGWLKQTRLEQNRSQVKWDHVLQCKGEKKI